MSGYVVYLAPPEPETTTTNDVVVEDPPPSYEEVCGIGSVTRVTPASNHQNPNGNDESIAIPINYQLPSTAIFEVEPILNPADTRNDANCSRSDDSRILRPRRLTAIVRGSLRFEQQKICNMCHTANDIVSSRKSNSSANFGATETWSNSDTSTIKGYINIAQCTSHLRRGMSEHVVRLEAASEDRHDEVEDPPPSYEEVCGPKSQTESRRDSTTRVTLLQVPGGNNAEDDRQRRSPDAEQQPRYRVTILARAQPMGNCDFCKCFFNCLVFAIIIVVIWFLTLSAKHRNRFR
ncbi:hypothetical protein TSAR_015008 [Trichomalopsis sarcophagae]|uniref:Uncharacterized protein n=1 Tax=Trichomalopsis sarcophagae TaxID=543379 RepID=A0A232EXL8_9HYME|nr:hypothetical protein TSAR_015008 [Trichomalopsis sarcophagae]